MSGLYGKLPGAGDFLTLNIPRKVLRPLEDWLSLSMTSARDQLGEGWETVFDTAPAWNFWIGAQVMGHPMAGTMLPSRDRVGRRFPALGFLGGKEPFEISPPIVEFDSEPYARLRAKLYGLQALPEDQLHRGLEQLSEGAAAPDALGGPALPTSGFWAVGQTRGPAGLAALIQDMESADHLHAAAGRSYWWCDGDATRVPAIHAAAGMPEPAVFGWFLQGLGESSFTTAGQSA
ncbi:MAG: type VI secretion system-associated protein TagF [Pseudomonadota bacterium]